MCSQKAYAAMFNPSNKKHTAVPPRTLHTPQQLQFLFLTLHQVPWADLSKRNERIDRYVNTDSLPQAKSMKQHEARKRSDMWVLAPPVITVTLSKNLACLKGWRQPYFRCFPSWFHLVPWTRSAMSSIMHTKNLKHGARLFSRRCCDTDNSMLTGSFLFIGKGMGHKQFPPP